MTHLPRRATTCLATAALLLTLGCVGPRIGVVPNDFSAGRSAQQQAADFAYCEAMAKAVHLEHGPFPTGTSFSDASTNLAYRTRYEAACMRVKGYDVVGSFRRQIEPIDLPARAVKQIREAQ